MEENKVEQILDLLELDVDLEELRTYLKSCAEYGVFISQDSSTNTVVSRAVNNCLNSKKTKSKGLLLLKEFIPYCSSETYSEYAISWMLQCLVPSNQSDLQVTVPSLEIFTKLLEKSVKFAEVSKETAKQIVPKFLTEYLKFKESNQIISKVLRCLEKCMKLYSGSCESQKEYILQYLLSLLWSVSSIVPEVANCISMLPGLGGGGKQGVTYKASWKLQHNYLIFVLHDILDQLFTNITEIQCVRRPEVQNSTLKIVFPQLPKKNTLSRAQNLARRLMGISECIRAMYLMPFSVSKEINHKSVLELICRGLSVTRASFSNNVSVDSLALASVLPTIHIAFLNMLESFILCCNRNILPEANLISKLLNHVMKSTSPKNWPYAVNKPYRSTRLATYKCLCTWLSIAQNASCLYKVAEELIPAILSDIYSKKPTITLTICPKSMKVGKINWKKQLSDMSKTNKDHVEKIGDMVANKQLCFQALATLELIINTASALLKPELFKMIEIIVVQILTELSGGSVDIPIPYSNADCRDHTYKLLLALCLQNGLPKYALALFTAGLNDISSQVRSRCASAISSLEKIYYPSAPSLHFPKAHENNVLSMTKEEILNSSLSSLSNNGVMVIEIMGKDKGSSFSDKEEEMNESVVEIEGENKTSSCSNYEKDANEKYFNNDYEVPDDSEIEVIDICDSDSEKSGAESNDNDGFEDIYEFSDEDETVLSGYENENISEANEDFNNSVISAVDNEKISRIKEKMLNGTVCYVKYEDSEGGIRETFSPVSESGNYETEGDLIEVNNSENDTSSLKRVNDRGLNEDLHHMLADGQPNNKKPKLQEENLCTNLAKDEDVGSVCKISAENKDFENIGRISPEEAENKDFENIGRISPEEAKSLSCIPAEDEDVDNVCTVSSKDAESVSKIPIEDTENVSNISPEDIDSESMLKDFVDSVC